MVGNVYELLDMQKDKNVPIQSRKNCVTVLGCDPALSGKIKFNTLSNRKNVEGALPWNKSEDLREWTNIDSEYLIYYMETYYLLNSDKKILSALEMVADTNKFNPFIDIGEDKEKLQAMMFKYSEDAAKILDNCLNYRACKQDLFRAKQTAIPEKYSGML